MNTVIFNTTKCDQEEVDFLFCSCFPHAGSSADAYLLGKILFNINIYDKKLSYLVFI
jgi:hypothetical protein